MSDKTVCNPSGVAVYHRVYAEETYDESTKILGELIEAASKRRPFGYLYLYLDIEGHRNSQGGFDADRVRLQSDYLIGEVMRHLRELHMPLGHYRNPKPVPWRTKP